MTEPRQRCAVAMRELVSWAASCSFERIPAPVLRRAQQVLADDLAAMVGARDEPQVHAFHQRVLARASSAQATVFRGGRSRTDPLWAAVANAVAADWLELDEGYRPAPCHAGLYVIPALLAQAEADNIALRRMLRALVLSYEISTRLARAWKLQAPTIQPHGRFSAIGTAAGIALLHGCDEELMAAALGTAVTLSGLSPRTHLAEGTLSRNVWPAAGAWSGMMAVEWAQCGIGGALTAFHDVYSSLLSGTATPQVLTQGLGEQWAILDGYTKIYACCQHLHSAVEAALALRDELQALATPADDIVSVTVATHSLALPLRDASPRTTLGAKFSMPHAVAAALVLGSAGADAFATDTLHAPALQQLRQRIAIEPFTPELPAPHDRPARIVLRLRSGQTLSRECLSALGGPDRPVAADTVFDKVEQLAGPVYPAMRRVLESATMEQGWASLVHQMCEQDADAVPLN